MPSECDLQFNSVVKAMNRINGRMEAELQKLMQSKGNFEMLQQIQDELYGNLEFLCNYESATDGNGKSHDIQEVITDLKVLADKTFKKLSGRDYVPTICRTIQHRREKENAR